MAVVGLCRRRLTMTRRLTAALLAVLCSATAAFAADQTWTGTIGDSKCGLSHKSMTEHNKGLTDRACTEACVKSGGKYVLTSNGKVYMIENQNDPALAANAGREVTIAGDIKGDT